MGLGSWILGSLAGDGTEQEEHRGTREMHLELTEGDFDQDVARAAISALSWVLQCCWVCGAALLLQIPTMHLFYFFFQTKFSQELTQFYLAFRNWHSSLYWQMFLICFKQRGQCDLFCLNSLHNGNT